ncbi:MAG: hypothetical protein M3Z95_00165 [Actinomycetota bacterium]|nr:hypothetical protein [Actinomycetota bacterium]
MAVAGCGGSSAGQTTPVRTALTEPISPRAIAKDRAIGERALLRESDFPSEYVADVKGAEDSLSPAHLARAVARTCLPHASALARKNPATVSQDVGESGSHEGSKGYVNIDSTVTVEPTVAAAKEWFSILDRPQTPTCIGKAFGAVTLQESPGLGKSGNSVGKTRVAHLAFARYGDQSVAYRLMNSVVAEGHNLAINLDYVVVRKERAHTMLTFEKVGGPVSAKMEQRLTAMTMRRLRP